MSFLKKFLSKKDHELSEDDKVKLTSILKNESNVEITENNIELDENITIKTETNLNLINFVEKLNSEDLKELRLILDKKEKQIQNIYKNSEENNNEEYISINTFTEQIGEVEIDSPITNKDLDKEEIKDIDNIPEVSNEEPIEIQEIEDINKIDEEVKIIKDNNKKIEENEDNNIEIEVETKNHNKNLIEEESLIKTEEVKTKNDVLEIKEDHPILEKSILEKIKDIFGRENIFEKIDTKSKHEIINGKNIQYIGIRKFDAFDKKDTALDQNAWFINNIKKLSELKQFKMVESNPSLKELIMENENNPIILCYKAIQLLKNKEEFEFD